MSLFRLDASIMPGTSTSAELADLQEAEWSATRAGEPEGWDHSTPYLRRILGDLWQADLTVIERELTLAGINPAMEHLKDLAAQRRTEAHDAARHTGRTLAAK